MAYQIKKTNRITEDVEFLGENGEVELTVKLDIDVERIAGDFRKAQIAVMNAEKAAKEKQTDEMLETYGKAIVEFIRLFSVMKIRKSLLNILTTDILTCCSRQCHLFMTL